MAVPLVACTDPGGELGGRVAGRLAAAGVRLRLVTPLAGKGSGSPGAEEAHVDRYDDPEGMRRTLAGVDTLYLVPVRESPDRVRQHRAAVDAAVDAGVRRVVYHSFLGASARSTFTLARDHSATEEHIRASGLAWSVVRGNAFLEVLRYVVGEDGVIRGPAGGGRLAPVARDDVADVTAAVLVDGDAYDGAVLDVTGPELLSMADVAAAFARATGRPVTYEEETLAEAYASREQYGAPDWQVEAWVTTYTQIAKGDLAVVTDTVERITGHPPVSLDRFLAAHPESLPG